ncbi:MULTISPECIES: L,D-transpeptidase family protein [Brucella]|uniref:Peptidoglycan-binding domain 1 protein n=2 Tax=Brucella melitensis TaxID=29459 RepID=C0RIA0_BRUMB|nr:MULTISPECIES: murein L,D-transpeptidase [Brucella]EXU83572.1 amidase [Brucella melitensis 548]ACO00558.1 Peptidoglycan-binding domain 1 protein [Brucella melitensis ATCC 23457]ADZ65849.1 peptidoglycan-binding domain 1 protein [Brucella melitensis M28]ADZ86717.1 peptidoglycan-binding domain 1 protein [Brucella melitensis M5-90]AEQ08387.1 Peptidoglycan-binding domain 1 protein [Brucella melitensis NI]
MTKTDRPANAFRADRRRFLRSAATAGLSVAVSAMVSSAYAQQVLSDVISSPRRGNWDDQFDARATGGRRVATNQPVLSPQTVADIQNAIVQYTDIASRGGWPLVPGNARLQIGVNDPAVQYLRKRLMISGDLPQEAGLSTAFDTYVDAALKRFQARHGLPADGVMGQFTYAAMNVDVNTRLGQLQTNLQRLAPLANDTMQEQRFVMVNIPAARIEAVEGGSVIQRHTAVVGKIDRQTPLLNSKIHEVILNPYWTAPKSIIQKDIIPLMRKDPEYLTKNKIRLYDQSGQEVPPESVDWNTDDAVKLMFRQDPGKINAMSSTKINFHNPYAVYMHDTPQKSYFNKLMRFDSSGCVRVQNVRDLDVWLLKNTPGWDRQNIEATIKSGVNTPIQLADPVPLHFVYISAWSTGDGVVQFRDDIYKMDGSTELALGTDT